MITFFDIPSTFPTQAWSRNTWKTRFSLNYKGTPYKTAWIEYPDIEEHCKKLGIQAVDTKADGGPHYTLPAIYDSTTGLAIGDSIRIAEYLDKRYPDTPPPPKLIPAGTEAL